MKEISQHHNARHANRSLYSVAIKTLTCKGYPVYTLGGSFHQTPLWIGSAPLGR